jgi:hypothetical protein
MQRRRGLGEEQSNVFSATSVPLREVFCSYFKLL